MKYHAFECEDAAAASIVNVKKIDPEDSFTYVILPDPFGTGKFIIEIVTPEWGSLGRI
ncbi:hypothetical protein [Methylocapsa aurea]|uniref:hypothetical protein n=1 Tax=Methylocapsa aurea TaxID=663610 RepID=UPI0012EC263D|nr:hypothetical protein [Methylocapsa aurea]